jgi:glycosyltransferase involved in cell wall biosynthesis
LGDQVDAGVRDPSQQRDRDFGGAVAYATSLTLTAVLAYAFSAILGRMLTRQDFATFGALFGVLLALSGPVVALSAGGAMASARQRAVPRPPWRRWLAGVGLAAGAVGFLPLPPAAAASAWFAMAAAMWLLTAWNRGLLIGLGRIGLVGGTMLVEAVARIGFAVALVAVGAGVAGASAGLAFGIAGAALLTHLLLPDRRAPNSARPRPEVWVAVGGLLFLGLVQFADVLAVRLIGPHQDGPYAAASSIARLALYAQAPAAAYALRRAAVAGPGIALRRSLLLALAPGGAVAGALVVGPQRVLSWTYGGRYVEAAGLLRTLAVAMLLSGLALVLVHLMMGAGRTVWAWSTAVVGATGVAGVFAAAAHPSRAAVAMLLAQGAILGIAALHARRLLSATRGADGAVLFLNWRDRRHPQGGGSEVFVEEVGRRLAAAGRRVTIFCAGHGNAPREEVVDGVRFLRRGSWRTVYLWAGVYHLLGRFGRHEVVVDVQNAVPFFSPLYCGRPVVVLVHHVHREQWEMIFGRRVARAGWWIESRLSPAVYRGASYVAVSEATKADLVALGVPADRISVVRNGSPELGGVPAKPEAAVPTLSYLGRLVPHKRVELLLDAAAELRREIPELRVRIVGRGPWDEVLRRHSERVGLQGVVTFEGFVDEEAKRRILAESWVLVLPSVKEGWGLAVMEAAAEGTPAVAFRTGGLRESILDGETGFLAEDYAGFVMGLRLFLSSRELRRRLGAAAASHAGRFTWGGAGEALERVLAEAAAGRVRWSPALQPLVVESR